MREVVLDSSVVVKWFTPRDEPHREEAEALRESFATGGLRLTAPRLLMFELVNTAARKWRWSAPQLGQLVDELALLRVELVDPPLPDVARWAAAGLTAYDAAFVVVAEAAGLQLITDDREVVAVAPEIARPLAEAAA